jgi:uncharacterized protein (TIGR03437 family)
MRTILVALTGTLCAAQTHYFVTTIAGSVPPLANPVALKQYLDYPSAVTYDAHGNLYYANYAQIWRLNPDGTDTLIAGTAPIAGTVGGATAGSGGLAINATFSQIRAMAFDPRGNLYIADGGIWIMTPDQKISLLLNQSNYAYFDFELGTFALAIDTAGNLYVSGFDSGGIMKYSPATQKWTSFAQAASFDIVNSLAVSGSKLYVLDTANYGSVMQVDLQTGAVSTAFTTAPNPVSLWALASGPDGKIYAASVNVIYAGNSQSGALLPIAGTAQGSYDSGDGGPATQAGLIVEGTLSAPGALAISPVNGDVAFADSFNHVFRVINGATNIIQTVAGTPHFGGDNGPAIMALFDASYGFGELAADGAGNLYLADLDNYRIRKIAPSGIVTTIAGNGTGGNSGDGGKAVQAEISAEQIAADKAGNVYFINSSAFESIRMVDLNGNIHTIAGGGAASVTNGAPATSVALAGLSSLAVDSSGNIYIGQNQQTYPASGTVNTNEVLKISSGKISIVAGASLSTSPAPSLAPDGAPAAGANIEFVGSVAVDNNGLVYFVESGSSGRIRMVNAHGDLVTIAGIVTNMNTITPLTQGPAKTAQLDAPSSLTFDAANNLYFANVTVNKGAQIAVIDASGTLTPIAGVPVGYPSYETTSGDGGDALQAGFASILGLTLDPSGNIYVLDSGVYIRKLSPYNPASPPPYLSVGGVIGAGGSVPAVAAVSPNGDASVYGGNFGATHTLAPADLVNGKVPTNLAGVCVSFGGAPAAMLGVYPSQINVQVPTLPPGPVTVQVTLDCGQSNAVSTNFAGVVVQAASPEFFSFRPDPAAGNNPIAAINVLTGTLIGAPGLLPGATFVPVKAGDIVEAFGTGWGSTAPAFGLGVLPGAAGSLSLPYTLTFAGQPVAASNIEYAGVAPCCAGLYQVNFTVPAGTPSGNQPLVITVGGVASPPNAYLTVQ